MKKLFLLMTVLVAILLNSCNKCNEDNPGDCKKCYERLAGQWTLNYLATNSLDSTNYFDSVFQGNCIFNFNLFDKNAHYGVGQSFGISWGNVSEEYFFWGGNYSAITKDGKLPILLDVNPNTNSKDPFACWNNVNADESWKIDKLSDTELWFEFDNENGNHCEMRFSK